MRVIPDSLEGIFSALQEGALTMLQDGGWATIFFLGTGGTPAKGAGVIGSGPVSFMRIWDNIVSSGREPVFAMRYQRRFRRLVGTIEPMR